MGVRPELLESGRTIARHVPQKENPWRTRHAPNSSNSFRTLIQLCSGSRDSTQFRPTLVELDQNLADVGQIRPKLRPPKQNLPVWLMLDDQPNPTTIGRFRPNFDKG